MRFCSVLFTKKHPPDIHADSIKNILVIRQHDQLGDMLCVIPLLKALKARFPGSHCTLIASPVNYEIMRHNPYVDTVLNYDKQALVRSLEVLSNFWRAFKQRKYDLAVVPVTVSISVTSDIVALLSGARIRIGAKSLSGNENPAAFCFTHPIDLNWESDPDRHQSLRNLDSITLLNPAIPSLNGEIGFTVDEHSKAKQVVNSFKKGYTYCIGFHPGAGKKENQWQPERFAEVANRIAKEYNAFIIITEGPKDADETEAMRSQLMCDYTILKQPIRSVAAIIHETDVFISNDTGIMHVAACTKTRLLALSGPTDPAQWSSKKNGDMFIAAENKDITTIPVETVYQAVRQLITTQN